MQVQPFAIPKPDGKPVDIDLVLRNRDERPVSGELTFQVPDGFEAIPSSMQVSALAPRAELTPHLQLRGTRTPQPQDQVSFRLTTDRGARVESSRTLVPTIADADNDGLADGWRLNPESTGTSTGQANAAEAAIEAGFAEFHCQKINCTRFVNGWIILSRDGQDRILKDRRYRVAFRARQQGLTGTIGVAVYNIKPWQGCGLERQFRVGEEWQTFSTDFTATRDSTNARFEFFFTEPGTLWIEGMRLEAADGTAP
ncbi:MAG: hypothetical protein A3K19_14190 [Lentisphaerae bacterium RIFOXYB12_FULL_65_16]|nr:MAG: hypothetical protein A3K18_16295 [Lentisphaerae bacterium RIFOXYA12_64_32]OGV89116.1 MAG: hypothetical protein A3K19_14190 [Lentisphaerae bacterium RIFOXYB12_FULL_65_16]